MGGAIIWGMVLPDLRFLKKLGGLFFDVNGVLLFPVLHQRSSESFALKLIFRIHPSQGFVLIFDLADLDGGANLALALSIFLHAPVQTTIPHVQSQIY